MSQQSKGQLLPFVGAPIVNSDEVFVIWANNWLEKFDSIKPSRTIDQVQDQRLRGLLTNLYMAETAKKNAALVTMVEQQLAAMTEESSLEALPAEASLPIDESETTLPVDPALEEPIEVMPALADIQVPAQVADLRDIGSPSDLRIVEDTSQPRALPTAEQIDEAVRRFPDLPASMIRHHDAINMLLILVLWLALKAKLEGTQTEIGQRAKQIKGWTYGILMRVFGLSEEEAKGRHEFSRDQFAEASVLLHEYPFLNEFLTGVRFYTPKLVEQKLVEFKFAWTDFPFVPRRIFRSAPAYAKFELIITRWLFIKSLTLVKAGELEGDELRDCLKRIQERLDQTSQVLTLYFGYDRDSIREATVSDVTIWQEVRSEVFEEDEELKLWLKDLVWSMDLPLPWSAMSVFASPTTSSKGTPKQLPSPGGAFGGGTSSTRRKSSRADEDRRLRNLMRGKKLNDDSSTKKGGQKKGGKPGK